MAKRKIPVTDKQVKETKLIETLNSNVLSKDSESTTSLVGTLEDSISELDNIPEIENETHQEALDALNNEASAYGCGTEFVEDDTPNFNKIESDQQRWIKYDTHADKKGYADAGPSPVCDNAMAFKELSPEEIKKLENLIKPIAKSYIEQVESNPLKDNEECRNTVNTELKETGLTESGREIMNRSKDIAGKLIGKDLFAKKKTLNDILLDVGEKDGNKTAISLYEMVNHPTHYNNYDIEAIEMIERIWGRENAALWCEITAFKYRLRMGTKPGEDITRDLNKEQWYLNKAKELRNKN